MATTSPAEASSETLSDDSESPSPFTKMKKAELPETTTAYMEKLKEWLNVEIRGGKKKEPTLPPPAPLRLKF